MRVILARARAELLPKNAMRIVPLLGAYTAKQREGLRSIERMQANHAALDRARLLVTKVVSTVCSATTVAKPSSIPSGAAEPLALATHRLVGKGGIAHAARREMARFVDIKELQRCMADRGCSDSQAAMAFAASHAARAFATSMEKARINVLATVPDDAASLAARAAQAGVAGRHFAAVGAWARALAQPGEFGAQLQLAACRESSVGVTPATATANASRCTPPPLSDGDGAIGVARVARDAALWPSELAKASLVIKDVGTDLESVPKSSQSILNALGALKAKVTESADLALEIDNLVNSLGTAVRGAAKADEYIANMTKASDALAQFLAVPSDLHPADVWVAPQPSAFTSGPRAWELVARSIEPLDEAYSGAERTPGVCTDVNASQAVDALELRLPAVKGRATSAGLPYSTFLVEAAEMRANITCLIKQLATTMHACMWILGRVLCHTGLCAVCIEGRLI